MIYLTASGSEEETVQLFLPAGEKRVCFWFNGGISMPDPEDMYGYSHELSEKDFNLLLQLAVQTGLARKL